MGCPMSNNDNKDFTKCEFDQSSKLEYLLHRLALLCRLWFSRFFIEVDYFVV